MKKLFVLFMVLILATGVAFAQEEDNYPENGTVLEQPQEEPPKERPIEPLNFEISIGFPIHWSNGNHNNEIYLFNPDDPIIMMPDKTVTANTSIGVALVYNITRTFGLALDTDFFYGAKLEGFSRSRSDHVALSGANIFFGPVFYVFNNNILRIPLSVGAHFYYFQDDLWVPMLNWDSASEGYFNEGAWINRHEFQFGPAISLAVQFHFGKDIYLFSRTSVAIDLLRWHTIRWYDGEEYRDTFDNGDKFHQDFGVNWLVKPSIGLGIKY